jgi:hypothetical protein
MGDAIDKCLVLAGFFEEQAIGLDQGGCTLENPLFEFGVQFSNSLLGSVSLRDISNHGSQVEPALNGHFGNRDISGEFGPIFASAEDVAPFPHVPSHDRSLGKLSDLIDMSETKAFGKQDVEPLANDLFASITKNFFGSAIEQNDSLLFVDGHDTVLRDFEKTSGRYTERYVRAWHLQTLPGRCGC